MVRLPPLSEVLSEVAGPPDFSGEGGAREPLRPFPKGPPGSSAREPNADFAMVGSSTPQLPCCRGSGLILNGRRNTLGCGAGPHFRPLLGMKRMLVSF
jgi:hypothetical protein